MRIDVQVALGDVPKQVPAQQKFSHSSGKRAHKQVVSLVNKTNLHA
jgi:hypothetical protein